MMKIQRRKNGDVAILDLQGKILIGDDINDLRVAVNNLVKDKEKKVLLNFEQVPYLDSTGLGEVVKSYTTIKRTGGMVKILNLSSKVKDLMTITKLITVFETFEDEEQAVASF
jgi:anti-sigma B factor antagonist